MVVPDVEGVEVVLWEEVVGREERTEERMAMPMVPHPRTARLYPGMVIVAVFCLLFLWGRYN